MKCPQTFATELNRRFPNPRLEQIAKHGCCAFVLLWCLGIEPSDIDAIITVDNLITKGAIKEDCEVKWASAVSALTGRGLKSIEFVDIKCIRNIKERTPVRFDYGEKSHWVGVENGKVVFNPLSHSNCVENGKPVTKRVLHLTGENK